MTRTVKVSSRQHRQCPECGETFEAHHGRQSFCCTAHQRAFHDRNHARGKVTLPLALVWRSGKNGRTDERAYAFAQLSALLDLYRAEDKAVGRRPDLIVSRKRADGWVAADLVG